MARTPSRHSTTREAILEASLNLIATKGYAAVGLRELAQEVGVQPASVYNYVKSKEELLFYLIGNTLELRLNRMRQALNGIDDPVQSLQTFVMVLIEFHTTQKREVLVGNNELRSLSKEHLLLIVNLRDEFDEILTQILSAGRRTGVFDFVDPRIATFAIISMISGISRWYRADGRLSIKKLAKMHCEFALSIARCHNAK